MLNLKTKIENQSNKQDHVAWLIIYTCLQLHFKKNCIYCCLFIERVHTPPPIFIVNIYILETPYPQMIQP